MLGAVGSADLAAQSSERAASGEFRPPTPSARHRQDSTRNNLVHPAGYATVPPGSLGDVTSRGTGDPALLMVAGLGVGSSVFDDLVRRHGERHRIVGVTLPGYGGSSAPPMPPEGTSFGERTWLAGAERGLAELIRREDLDRPIVVAFYTDAANPVVHLAASRPDLVGGVLLVSTSPRVPVNASAGSRGSALDQFAEQWFRTVTEIMWPSGMFTPDYYSNTPDVAERMWWEVLQPTLPTAIRYMVESWADDLVPVAARLRVPTIALSPGFDETFLGTRSGALVKSRMYDGWAAALEAGADIDHRIVDGARYLIWVDRPEAVDEALADLVRRR